MEAIATTRRELLAGAAAAVAAGSTAKPAQAAVVPRSRQGSAAGTLAAGWFAGNPAPALSVAVARGDRVVWAQAFGSADLELGVRATTDHKFRLGSVSKVLTSTAAARLASRGALDLDAPISKWLPDLPQQHRATTLRQLLTHRGGIRHYQPKDLDVSGPGGAIYSRIYPTDQDVLALFVNDPLVHPPGTAVAYSSFGYTLASLAMQASSGRDFRQLILEEVGRHFDLGTLADDDPWAIRPARAKGYINARDMPMLYGSVPETARPKLTDGWANMPFSNPAYAWAAGGFIMTPSDTARFGASMLEGSAAKISSVERALLFTPMTEKTSQVPAMGLGWRISTDARNRMRWHHEGATPGGRYALAVYPDAGLSIAIAANELSVPLDVGKAASDLADIFSGQGRS